MLDDGLGAFVPGSPVRLEGANGGPLSGLGFAVKDIFDIAGHVTGCGNPDWARTHAPATATAPAVQSLLDAGATMIGKTVTDELAYSLNGQNHHYGTPTNGNAPGRIPGGSSSGSASAVAGGACDFALGSDTGGSVRIPGSYCGLFGIRTSHGRLALDGIMPLAPSFDTIGWFARDPALLRRVGEVLLGPEGEAEPTGLLFPEDAWALADAPARDALLPFLETLQARFGVAERVVLGEPGGGLARWMLRFRHLQAAEIRALHEAWIDEVKPKFGAEVGERFAWALDLPASLAEDAKPEREAFADRLRDLLRNGALLCLPTAPGIAPPLDASPESLRTHRGRVLSLTSIAGLARLPQVTLPLARVSGCPVGLSLIGMHGGDGLLLRLAEAVWAAVSEAVEPLLDV